MDEELTTGDGQFVQEHDRWVKQTAMRVKAQLDLSCEIEDLHAYGLRGLVEASARFDPTRGVQFRTFAYYRVRGAILDGVREMAYLPRKIHAARKAAEVLDRMAEGHAERRGQGGEDTALSRIDDILTRTSAAFVMASVGQNEDSASVDSPEEQVIGGQTRARIRALLPLLPERERRLVEGYYFRDETLEDIGAEMGLSKSWASRLHARALGRLRDAFLREPPG